MAFSPKPLDIEVTASTPIVKKQSVSIYYFQNFD